MKNLTFLPVACLLLLSGCGGGNSAQFSTPPTPTFSPSFVLTAANLRSVAWIGDSYAVNGNIVNPFASSLQSRYGNGGIGWINLFYLSSINPGVTIGGCGTWVRQRNTATATGLNISDVRTTDITTPARITVSINTQTATLYYYTQPGGGTFKWWVDEDAPSSVNTASSSPGIGSSKIANLSEGTHLFQIQIETAGTAGIALAGIDAKSASIGTVVHNLGSAGSSTENWINVDAKIWETQLAALHPTLVLVMLSPNDQYDAISTSQQYANLATLIGRIRTAAPNVPIILTPPPDNGLGRTPTMSDYNSSQKALATALRVGYIDVFDEMGPFNPAYFESDLLHLNSNGGARISNIILAAIDKYMQ